MPTTPFHPPLSNLLSTNSIPNNLSFIENGIEALLDGLTYKDLQVNKSYYGEVGSYRLKILTQQPIALEIPGTNGLRFIINPSTDTGPVTSEFQVSLTYQILILRYIREFQQASFAESFEILFGIFLDITNTTQEEILQDCISTFIDPNTGVSQFVLDINNNPDITLTVPISLNTSPGVDQISDLVNQVEVINGLNIYDIVAKLYVSKGDNFDEIFDNIKNLFKTQLGEICSVSNQSVLN